MQKQVGSGVPRCGKEGEWLRPLLTGRAHPLAPLPSGCYLCPPGRNLREASVESASGLQVCY